VKPILFGFRKECIWAMEDLEVEENEVLNDDDDVGRGTEDIGEKVSVNSQKNGATAQNHFKKFMATRR